MRNRNAKGQVCVCLVFFGLLSAAPAFAGSAVIGSVAGSMNATIGGQALLPNTTIFSGDSIDVRDGVAVVAVDKANRMVFGRETTASFLRSSDEVTVLLSRGNLSMYHADEGGALRVKVGELSVSPAKGFKTLGEVAMVGGTIVVTTKEGMLRLEGKGSAQEVAKGKTITIPVTSARAPKAGAAAGPPVGGADTSTALEVGALGASAAAAVLSGISISRANDAKDAATAADADAKAATAAATLAANNAATAAASAAIAATNSTTFCKKFVSPSSLCL